MRYTCLVRALQYTMLGNRQNGSRGAARTAHEALGEVGAKGR